MKYLLFFSLLVGVSCNNTAVQDQLKITQQDLANAKEKIKQLEAQIESEGDLVHLVYFKLKPDADQAALIAEVKKLESIKEVMDLEIGPFVDLGDERALSDYSMLMQMSFTDKVAYAIYQKHPLHLQLKEQLGSFLAGPPATYDFRRK